ncbi:MAG: lipoate protein ligase C-terminal domain-containing protein [Pseudomonadota bacterium]
METPIGMNAVEIRRDYKVPSGKLLRCKGLVEDGCIRKIMISGDFFVYPEDSIERLENAIVGKRIVDLNIDKTVSEIFDEKATLIGFKALDLVELLKSALKSA